MSTSSLRQGPFLLGLLMVTAATLALEVLDTRLLSVVTWYSLAFFVIAMGLCGLTAGAVRVYLRPEEYAPERLSRSLARAGLWFAWSVPVSFVLLLVVPLRVEAVATTALLFLVFSIALALPFYPAGVIVAAAVTRTKFPVGRVYAVDLLGAALGAPLVPLALHATDGGTAILLCGTFGALAAMAFARAGGDKSFERKALATLVALGIVTTANGISDRGLVPLWFKERPADYSAVEKELWNSHSLVQVFKAAEAPAMFWGLGAKCVAPVITQRLLVIDGHAGTPLYHAPEGLEQLRFLECDVTDVANLLRPGGPAAVIGVGGSRDIQASLLSGHAPVVGVELNGRMLQILRGPMGEPTHVADHPSVELVHDDARSYFAHTQRHFRVIQASLIDTWAATGAGAHALGENGLYTLEAWRSFLQHLEPSGVFTVSRWSSVETARMMALASAALLEIGAKRPADHMAMVTAGLVTTLIVGKEPLSPADEETLGRIAAEKGFFLQIVPSRTPAAPRIRRVLEADSLEAINRTSLQDLLDFRPATDDRPFFFNVLRFRSLWHELPEVAGGTIQGNLLATRTLGLAFIASFVLAIVAIVGPLAYRARPRGRAAPGLYAGLSYFCLIGVGFMLTEIGLLQRLSLVLGHPIYSLIVVLSSLVAAAGLGSLLSDRLPLDRSPWCYVFPLVIAAWIATLALAWPGVAARFTAAPLGVRIAFSVAVTASLGVTLGVAFPAGMRMVRATHDEETPWFWGLNGVGSVIASSGAILIALSYGLTVLLLVGAGCYLLLSVAVLAFRRAAPIGAS